MTKGKDKADNKEIADVIADAVGDAARKGTKKLVKTVEKKAEKLLKDVVPGLGDKKKPAKKAGTNTKAKKVKLEKKATKKDSGKSK